MTKILVTGCLGFIGSYFCRETIRTNKDVFIVGVDRNTDQRKINRLEDINDHKRFRLIFADLAKDDISEIFEDIDYCVHFAAKTFVDHSIRSPESFIQSNIVGTYKLLEEARKSSSLRKFIQVSTDEVYGQILKGAYTEEAKLNPSNPYSATKAAGDMLALAYHNTYGLPIIITRTENNYGPWQHNQKVIPTFVRHAITDKPLPIYGDGKHRRMWLWVGDHCDAIHLLLKNGKNGDIYHIAGEQELENLQLAYIILDLCNKPKDQIRFIDEYNIRPGHDRRYALNTDKLKALGWAPKMSLLEGIKYTVEWYKNIIKKWEYGNI